MLSILIRSNASLDVCIKYWKLTWIETMIPGATFGCYLQIKGQKQYLCCIDMGSIMCYSS